MRKIKQTLEIRTLILFFIFAGILGMNSSAQEFTYQQDFSTFDFADGTEVVSFGDNNEWIFNATGDNLDKLNYNGDWDVGSITSAGFRGNSNVMGYQHTSSTGIFTATLTLTNNTGEPITLLNISYLGKVARTVEGRTPEWTVTVNGTTVPELAYSTSSNVDEAKSAAVNVNIPNGDDIIIVWSSDRGAGSGSSKQIGIASLDINASEATQAANPTFSHPSGTYYEPFDLGISSVTPDATVYYSTDSETGPWTEYTTAINISTNTTVWAYAEAAGLADSDVVSAQYDFLNLILEKDFEDESLTSGGWMTFDVIAGANTWVIATYSGITYAQISEYQSDPQYPHSWLISPEVDLSTYNTIDFTFDSNTGYRFGDALSVHISTNYDGVSDPTTATWTELPADFNPHQGTGYGTWYNSGVIDLSAYNETVHIGFQYLSDADNMGTWQVNDIFVTSPDEPISTDATLSTFEIGGLNALGLANVVVEDPDVDPGATLAVEDFTGFEGIDVVTNHDEATYEVTLNGTIVDEVDLATQAIAENDVIVVTVTAEDMVTENFYKVTVIQDNREIVFVTPVGGEEYYTGDEILIEWTSANITLLDLHVYSVDDTEPVAVYEDIAAADESFTENLPNGAHGTFFFRLYDSNDANYYEQSENVTFIDDQAPIYTELSPINGAVDVDINTTLEITFDEYITENTGNIVIYNSSDDSVVETIDVTSAQVSIVEEQNVVITLNTALDYETEYYVLVDANAFEDIAANPFAGISDPAAWTFTTEEEVLPQWICNGDFELWTDDKPDCWFGSKTHTEDFIVNQYSTSAQSGDYAVQLINDEGSHRRFSSHAVAVENEKTYKIDFWVRGHGDIRTALFDDRDFDYGYTYNSYLNINSSDWVQYTQYVTAAKTTDIAEFIFSVVETQADLDHIQIDNVVIEEFEFDSEVETLAELKNGIVGGEYTYIGEAVVTFQQGYRNQKFIQDASGAIMIDDADGIIVSEYSIGDGISNISGVLDSYAGMMQFQPNADPGDPSSIGNPVVPESMTLADITSDDQAKLVKIEEVDFDSSGTFEVGTVYNISDPSGAGIFRTNFYDANYIGNNIPTETINLIALITEHYGDFQLTARSSDDFQEIVNVDIIESDQVNIYPNPFSNNVSVRMTDNVKEIVMLNNVGQEYRRFDNSNSTLEINTSDLEAGVYFLQIIMKDGSRITKKLIKY
ncbi:MAG: choice-of-anchor J domain-containing protein [Bacteroidota bacterium]